MLPTDCPRKNRWVVSDAMGLKAQPLNRLIRPPDLADLRRSDRPTRLKRES